MSELARVITLDCWETLIHDSPELGGPRSAMRIHQMAQVLQQRGHAVDEAVVGRAYESAGKQYETVWETDLELDTHEQLTIMLEAIDAQLPSRLDSEIWSDLTIAYVDPILTSPPRPAEHVVATLVSLKDRGFQLGLICNTGRSPGWAMRQLLDRYGILAYLDDVAFSNEEGLRKPRPEIFQRLLDRLGVVPAQALHVGDDPRTDIGGAAALGMGTVIVGERSAEVVPTARIAAIRELPLAIERLIRDGILRTP